MVATVITLLRVRSERHKSPGIFLDNLVQIFQLCGGVRLQKSYLSSERRNLSYAPESKISRMSEPNQIFAVQVAQSSSFLDLRQCIFEGGRGSGCRLQQRTPNFRSSERSFLFPAQTQVLSSPSLWLQKRADKTRPSGVALQVSLYCSSDTSVAPKCSAEGGSCQK